MFNFFSALEEQSSKTSMHLWDDVFIGLYPKIPTFDIFNYFNLCNQLQIVLFYKHINEEFVNQFSISSDKHGHTNNLFAEPYTEIAIQYYQDKLSKSLNKIINAYCPFKTFYNFKDL